MLGATVAGALVAARISCSRTGRPRGGQGARARSPHAHPERADVLRKLARAARALADSLRARRTPIAGGRGSTPRDARGARRSRVDPPRSRRPGRRRAARAEALAADAAIVARARRARPVKLKKGDAAARSRTSRPCSRRSPDDSARATSSAGTRCSRSAGPREAVGRVRGRAADLSPAFEYAKRRLARGAGAPAGAPGEPVRRAAPSRRCALRRCSPGLRRRQARPVPPPAESELRSSTSPESSGIRFRHRSGAAGKFLLPEIMGGGGGFLDYDGDGGSTSISCSRARSDAPRTPALPNRLFRNDGARRLHGRHGRGRASAAGVRHGLRGRRLRQRRRRRPLRHEPRPERALSERGGGTFTRRHRRPRASATPAGRRARRSSTTTRTATSTCSSATTSTGADARVPDKKCFSLGGTQDYCSPQAYGAPVVLDALPEPGRRDVRGRERARRGSRRSAGPALGVVCTDLTATAGPTSTSRTTRCSSFAWINQGDGTLRAKGARPRRRGERGRPVAGRHGRRVRGLRRRRALDLWKVHLYREGHILYLNRGSSSTT